MQDIQCSLCVCAIHPSLLTHLSCLSGIILARTKLATKALTDFIRESTFIKALPCRVEPQRFVGQGDYEDDCMTEAEQRLVLESFRDGELACSKQPPSCLPTVGRPECPKHSVTLYPLTALCHLRSDVTCMSPQTFHILLAPCKPSILSTVTELAM